MVIGQRVFSYVGIWEGSIVFEVLYLLFKAEAIVSFVAGFLVVMAIIIEVATRRYGIRHRCRV